MKSLIHQFKYLFALAMIASLTSCVEDNCESTRTFIEFESIYVQPEEFRGDNISYMENRQLENPGKIYYYNNILMVNERYEGIHLYDNANPEAPSYLGFIAIPGNLDVSIKNNIMYADNYVDLLTIDVSDLTSPKLLDRQEEVFNIYDYWEELGYFIYTKETERTLEVACDENNFNDPWFWRDDRFFALPNASFELDGIAFDGSTATPGSTGQGGSFARFSVLDDHLYVLNNSELKSFDIQNLEQPTQLSEVHVDWGRIETLFPYGQYLFIGGTEGMYIYDRSNPDEPSFVSRFTHARACDPVFVQGDFAYVTLRNGSQCESFTNQLDVVDISNINNPQLRKSYDMTNPHGLAVINDDLYICDGDAGLRVFDKSDLDKIDENQVEHIKDIHAYDIIPLTADHMIVVGDGGLYQYDSRNPSSLQQLSFVSISN